MSENGEIVAGGETITTGLDFAARSNDSMDVVGFVFFCCGEPRGS
jgi:hypothetical protein